MKTVVIIGAGPAGLVAAKNLCGSFSVTILDQAPRIGGLWDFEGLINPAMQTNLSRYTVAFSDLAWESVNRYLQEYCRRFVSTEIIRFNTRVTHVDKIETNGGDGVKTQWRLTTVARASPNDAQVEKQFIADYLVVATGFSSHPAVSSCELSEKLQFGQRQQPAIIHSTQYRSLADVFPDDEEKPNQRGKKKILMVGGSHSGSDIATTMALELSSQDCSSFASSPDTTTDSERPSWEIIHIMANPMYAIPAFIRADDDEACAFMPLDFKLYNRSNLPPEPPPKFSFAMATPEKLQQSKKMVHKIIHGRDPDPPADQDNSRPFGVVSESYNQYVKSGHIKPKMGRLRSLNENKMEDSTQPKLLTATITSPSGNDFEIGGINAVVQATGFNATKALSFLSNEVKEQLGYDESFPRVPLALDADFVTGNSKVPEFACIGFSMGPYWGAIEMQARVIAARWTKGRNDPQSTSETATYMKALRDANREGRLEDIPPIIFGDYIGLMEQVCRELDLERIDLDYDRKQDPISPARYSDPGEEHRLEAKRTMTRLQQVQRQAKSSNLFVARAVFHGLHGKWITSNNTEGNESTRIAFYPRTPTAPLADFEYLVETRVTSATGAEGKGQDHSVQWFVYRYQEIADNITIWSVKDKFTAESHLFTLEFGSSRSDSEPNQCCGRLINMIAPSDVESKAAYRFKFQGALLDSFVVESEGRPSKQYVYLETQT